MTQDNRKYSDSLEIQRRLSSAHNYNEWLFSQVAQYVNGRVLEVGCAIGNFTEKLTDKTFVYAIDIENEYVASARDTLKGHPNIKIGRYDISAPNALELGSESFDSAICFNVLEHIEDDMAALRNIRTLLREGGHLCLIVPAFQSIFGSMDRTDNHCRRYSKSALLKKAEDAGFKRISLRYLNIPGFFGWWFNGKVLKKRYIPFKQMMAYDKVIPVIRLLERIIEPPIGQSIVMIAKAE